MGASKPGKAAKLIRKRRKQMFLLDDLINITENVAGAILKPIVVITKKAAEVAEETIKDIIGD